MIEKINVDGKQVLVLVEPHVIKHPRSGQRKEYFTASYALEERPQAPGGVMLLEDDKHPMRFDSPVEALAYASKRLSGMV